MKMSSFKKKLYKNWFMRKIIALSNKMWDIFDGIKDKKICGCSLVKYVPSLYRESKGATGSQSTRYCILKEIFEGAEFEATDKFIDVGCGKGRVLAYMVGSGFPGEISGIELNHEVAECAKKWAEKYDNVTVIEGDAFEQSFNDYNIFFFGRPFEKEFFAKFIDKFEKEITHPIKVYYWVEQESGSYLDNREGWTLQKREIVFKRKCSYVTPWPQRYSIWTFTPKN